MKRLTFTLVITMLGVAPAVAAGQSLAAVAKKEEARRQAVAQPGKVYTNADLKRDVTPVEASAKAAPSEPDAPANAPPGATDAAGTDAPVVDDPAAETTAAAAKDEAYWRARIGEARAALERSRIFADALQSRINALSTDFVNRDDPAQRTQIDLERQRAVAELERVKKEMDEQSKVISGIEEEARKAGVPPGWLR